MKKYINGEYIEMTEEEMAETQRMIVECDANIVPALLERIEAIEGAILEGVLLGG